jgi:hypothetical protein
MTENNNKEFLGDDAIKLFVERLWSKVFEASNKLIRDTKLFGFSEIEALPNPNVHQMLASLTVIDVVLDQIMMMDQDGTVSIGDTRLLINAKQQIFNMTMIAAALKAKDRESYDEAVRRLHDQAQI